MNKNKEIMKFFARLLIALVFLLAGIGKVTGFEGTIAFMQAFGITTATALILILAIIFELGGSFFVLFGYRTKLGALMLIIFTVIVTSIFHLDFANQLQFTLFLKNLAIIGGLVYVMAEGPGYISFDAKRNGNKKLL